MDQFEQIKKLKNQYIEAGKKIAGYESQLKTIEETEKSILAQCKEYGVTPLTIKTKQEELSKEYLSLIQQIEDAFNPNIKASQIEMDEYDPFAPDDDITPVEDDEYDPFSEDDLPSLDFDIPTFDFDEEAF